MSSARNSLISAVRGPILLITVGSLFALDAYGNLSFSRSWPVIIIVLGVMKLLERVAVRTSGNPGQGGAA
jgi:hypothetical protein